MYNGFFLNFERSVKQWLRKYQWATLASIRMEGLNQRILLIERADGHFWTVSFSVPLPKTQIELQNSLLLAAEKAIKEWKPKKRKDV